MKSFEQKKKFEAKSGKLLCYSITQANIQASIETAPFFVHFFISCLLSYYGTSWDNSGTTYFTAISFYEVPTSIAKMSERNAKNLF